MRLGLYRRAQSWRAGLLLAVMKLLAGEQDPVVKTALMFPDFFGRSFLTYVAAVMRGPSALTPGEREVIAGVVSAGNQCPFCHDTHSAVARLRFRRDLTADALRQWRDLDWTPEFAALLAFVEKASLLPDDLTLADGAALRSAGVGKDKIAQALEVAFVFNTVNRVANAMDFSWQNREGARRGAWFLNRLAYRVPGFFLR